MEAPAPHGMWFVMLTRSHRLAPPSTTAPWVRLDVTVRVGDTLSTRPRGHLFTRRQGSIFSRVDNAFAWESFALGPLGWAIGCVNWPLEPQLVCVEIRSVMMNPGLGRGYTFGVCEDGC